MEALGEQRPEIPVVLSGPAACSGIAFDSPVQIGEVVHISDKEGGCVVSNKIPVALLGVELDSYSRMSRSQSAAPRSPATVENRMNTSVSAPGCRTFAFVYFEMSWVTVNFP